MLVDPSGNRTQIGDSPKSNQGRVEFLVEVCDPSEAANFGYSVNGFWYPTSIRRITSIP
jgi:hypothetical protein